MFNRIAPLIYPKTPVYPRRGPGCAAGSKPRFACNLLHHLAVVRDSSAIYWQSLLATGLLLILLLGTPFSAYGATDLQLNISGVDEALERNIRNYLELPDQNTDLELKKFSKAIPANANKALQAIGYYNADYQITRAGDTNNPVINVNVIMGQPVKIVEINILIDGDASEDPVYSQSIAKKPIVRNGIFTHAAYEATKNLLFDAAQDRGYFDFEFTKSTVQISRKANTAKIILEADTGIRYTFADVFIKSDYFSEEFLRRYVPFKQGDYFESKYLGQLTRQMQETGFFSSVKVIPLRGESYGKQVPIQIEAERKDKNYLGIGIGFATDTLWRTKLTWSKPLVNTKGHSFDSELGLSTIEQKLSFQYRIPRTTRPLSNYWSFEYGLQNINDDDTKSFLSTLNFQRIRQTGNDWRESLFLRWERETYTVGGVKDRTDLLLPGISYNKNKSTGLPFPTAGYSTNFQFMYGSRQLLSTIDFYKSILNYKTLKSFGKRHTFILTLQYGAISTNDFTRVPASQRFYAGGDRSIRGFKYRGVGPTNPDGEVVGGRYLEVTSLEYTYRFKPRWAAAVFVDAGRAFNNFDEAYSVGAGAGIRWFSPVGPFRVDIASDISETSPGYTLHLSLGPDL